jgi:hypothetical protein
MITRVLFPDTRTAAPSPVLPTDAVPLSCTVSRLRSGMVELRVDPGRFPRRVDHPRFATLGDYLVVTPGAARDKDPLTLPDGSPATAPRWLGLTHDIWGKVLSGRAVWLETDETGRVWRRLPMVVPTDIRPAPVRVVRRAKPVLLPVVSCWKAG